MIGLIGERGRELQRVPASTRWAPRAGRAAWSWSRPPTCRRCCAAAAAYLTLTIAEFLRDQGLKVLCLIDSVTRFAMALREICLAAGEVPTSRGYPPGVFAELPRLLERAGPGDRAGQHHRPVHGAGRGRRHQRAGRATRCAASWTGTSCSTAPIAERGRFPAVDALRSISRTRARLLRARGAGAGPRGAPAAAAACRHGRADPARRLSRAAAIRSWTAAIAVRAGARASAASRTRERALHRRGGLRGASLRRWARSRRRDLSAPRNCWPGSRRHELERGDAAGRGGERLGEARAASRGGWAGTRRRRGWRSSCLAPASYRAAAALAAARPAQRRGAQLPTRQAPTRGAARRAAGLQARPSAARGAASWRARGLRERAMRCGGSRAERARAARRAPRPAASVRRGAAAPGGSELGCQRHLEPVERVGRT